MADFSFDSPTGSGGTSGGSEFAQSFLGAQGGTGSGSDTIVGTDGDNNGDAGKDSGAVKTPDIGPATVKRRGRQPYPRDADGNIIRPANTGTGKVQAGAKLAVTNDRVQVSNQIQAMHNVVAVLTSVPEVAMTKEEGDKMSSALCAVLDEHGINLNRESGRIGLYVTLGITAYTIEKPKLAALATKRPPKSVKTPAASSPSNVHRMQPVHMGAQKMDFSGDIT